MLDVLKEAVSDKWKDEEVTGGIEKDPNKGTEIEQRFKCMCKKKMSQVEC